MWWDDRPAAPPTIMSRGFTTPPHWATKDSAENVDVSDLFLSLSKMSRLSPDGKRRSKASKGENQVERRLKKAEKRKES